MEEMFDEAYDRYMAKKEGSAKQRKRAKQTHVEKLKVPSLLLYPHVHGSYIYFWNLLCLCRRVMEMRR